MCDTVEHYTVKGNITHHTEMSEICVSCILIERLSDCATHENKRSALGISRTNQGAENAAITTLVSANVHSTDCSSPLLILH